MSFNLTEYYDDLNLENNFSDLTNVNKNDIIILSELMKMDNNSTLDYPVIDDMHLWEYVDENTKMILWEIVNPDDKRYIQRYYIPCEDIAYYENEKVMSWEIYKAVDHALFDIQGYSLTDKQYSKLKEKILKRSNKYIDSIYKKYWTPKWCNPTYFNFN